MKDNPLLSVVVTSYTTDRLADIYELLDSVAGQDYVNMETVFVAERSLELMERVREYADYRAIPNVQVVFNDGAPGLSAARNVGIGQAKGDIIAFVDDDVVLFPDWAQEMVKAYVDESVIGITGPAYPLWEEQSMSWFPREFYWIFSCTGWCDWDEPREVRNAWGMNMSFAREAFEQGHMFSRSFGLCNSRRGGWRDPPSEDVDFSLRVRRCTGKNILFNPSVRVRHRVRRHRLTVRFIAQRACSVGYQRRMLKILYPEDKDAAKLTQERQLLRRILTGLVPDILRTSLRNPVAASRKLTVTFVAVSCVGLGYLSQPFSRSEGSGTSLEEAKV